MISNLFTVCVFSVIGWRIAGRRQRRAGALAFVGLSALAAVGFSIGEHVIVIGVGRFWILFRWMTVAACVGAGLRMVWTNHRFGRIASA